MRRDQDRDAEGRVGEVVDAQRQGLGQELRGHDRRRRRAEVGQHLVGQDQRHGDRDQRLPQVLALVPAQEQLMHDQADGAAGQHRQQGGQRPRTCRRPGRA